MSYNISEFQNNRAYKYPKQYALAKANSAIFVTTSNDEVIVFISSMSDKGGAFWNDLDRARTMYHDYVIDQKQQEHGQPDKDGWYDAKYRLPDNDGDYEVTICINKEYDNFKYVHIAHFYTGNNPVIKRGFYKNYHAESFSNEDVIAWKELNKPYEG